jgi:hypothetical protein
MIEVRLQEVGMNRGLFGDSPPRRRVREIAGDVGSRGEYARAAGGKPGGGWRRHALRAAQVMRRAGAHDDVDKLEELIGKYPLGDDDDSTTGNGAELDDDQEMDTDEDEVEESRNWSHKLLHGRTLTEARRRDAASRRFARSLLG